MGGAEQTADRHCGVMNGTPLPLPLGEVSERSEDGEGKRGCNTLSVTCGDSSPKGACRLHPECGIVLVTERVLLTPAAPDRAA